MRVTRAIAALGALTALVIAGAGADAGAGAQAVPQAASRLATGHLTCAISGALRFDPPLTPGNGTFNVPREIVSLDLSLSGCVGAATDRRLTPTASATVVSKQILAPDVKVARRRYAGGCAFLSSTLTGATLQSVITWSNDVVGTTVVAPVVFGSLGAAPDGFTATGRAMRSFAGPAAARLYLEHADEAALEQCAAGGGGAIASVTLDPTRSTLTLSSVTYTANAGDGTITPIDTATNVAGSSIPAGSSLFAIALAPDGAAAYVTDTTKNAVIPVDLTTGVAGTPIPVGGDPTGIAVTPDGSRAYVASEGSANITPIDLATGTTLPTIPVGGSPADIAISPDGASAYVTNIGTDDVTVVDLATAAVSATIPVGALTGGVAVARDGRTVYVTDPIGNNVIVIDTATHAVVKEIPVPTMAGQMAVSPDGRTLYVASNGSTFPFASPFSRFFVGHAAAGAGPSATSGFVTPIDTATDTAGTPIPVDPGAFGIAITPDGSTVYTAAQGADTVTPVDTATGTAGPSITVGPDPTGLAVG